MGTISYQIPQAGQLNSTEDAKVATALTTLLAAVNGNIDTNNLSGSAAITGAQLSSSAAIADTQLASPNNSARRLVLTTSGFALGTLNYGASTDYMLPGSQVIASGGGLASNASPAFWYPDSGLSSQPTNFSVAGKTRKARVRATIVINSTTPSVNVTPGLYQLTGLGGGGGSITFNFGSAVAGSTVTQNNPVAVTAYGVESGEFALPTANSPPFFLGVNLSGGSGTLAANSILYVTAQLYTYVV